MKCIRPLICAALVASASIPAIAQAPASPDSDFLTAAQGQMLGLYALGALARDHAQSSDVKALAETLTTQTASANRELKELAKSHDVTLPNKPLVRYDAQYGDIQNLKGSDFDARFKEDMNVDLSFIEDRLNQEIQNGTDNDVKAFAKTQLAAIKKAESQLSK